VLEPKDTSTTIGSVKIAIDGASHIPTRVQVFPRGSSTPAFEVGFTSFTPQAPSDSVFSFNPPPGATVSEGLGGTGSPSDQAMEGNPGSATDAKPTVVGDGWTSVVVADLPQDGASGRTSTPLGSLDSVIKKLPTVSGAWGSGHLLEGTLFSVLLTDDGRVVAGAVQPEALYAALTDG
jgi:hypothetical protein